MRRKREETDFMQKYEIQKLRDLPIEKVAKEMGMKVEHHKTLCPFHDDHHASLSFNTRKNNCRCYVCMGDSVGTIDLVMKYLGKDFLSACRWLAEEHQVQLEEDRKREASSSSSSPEPLHPVVLPRKIIRVVFLRENPPPLMRAGMRDSSSIPGSTWRPEGFSSRRGRLMREWLYGAD